MKQTEREVETVRTPQFLLRHRLALALEDAGISRETMAKELGIHRNTVANYLTGTTTPMKPTLMMWAAVTGVRYDWLLHGDQLDPLDVRSPQNSHPKVAGGETYPDNPVTQDICSLDRDSYYHSTELLPHSTETHSYQETTRRVNRQTFCVLTRKVAVKHTGWRPTVTSVSGSHGRCSPRHLHTTYTRRGHCDFDPEVQPVRAAHSGHLRRARPACVPRVERGRQLS